MPASLFVLNLPRCLGRRFRLALGLRFHLARLLFHPLIQLRLLEAPPIAQLERGNLLFADVLVQSVWAHAQILRRLANVHHFSRISHGSLLPPLAFSRPNYSGTRVCFGRLPHPLYRLRGRWCPEHISAGKSPGSE